jgi:hypothetical protein
MRLRCWTRLPAQANVDRLRAVARVTPTASKTRSAGQKAAAELLE